MLDCGYTPAEIREMTLDDVARLNAHMRRFPPLRVLVAAVAGFKPKPPDKLSSPTPSMTAEEAAAQVALAGGRIIRLPVDKIWE